jgi:hypothetical protein
MQIEQKVTERTEKTGADPQSNRPKFDKVTDKVTTETNC